jgi:transposase
MTESKIKSATKLLKTGMVPKEVAKDLGVSLATLYRWIPEAAALAQ